MALEIQGKFKYKGIQGKSGHLYKFRYSAGNEDPEPLVILLYRFKGYHPKTGRQGRFIQALNMNYVPRHIRKNFIINGKITLERNNGNVLLTGDEVKAKYPGLVKSDCIRRYFYSPNYYIQNPEYIPVDKMEDAMVSSGHKDFSKKLKMSLTRKFRSAQQKKKKRTDKSDVIGNVLNYLFGRKKK